MCHPFAPSKFPVGSGMGTHDHSAIHAKHLNADMQSHCGCCSSAHCTFRFVRLLGNSCIEPMYKHLRCCESRQDACCSRATRSQTMRGIRPVHTVPEPNTKIAMTCSCIGERITATGGVISLRTIKPFTMHLCSMSDGNSGSMCSRIRQSGTLTSSQSGAGWGY